MFTEDTDSMNPRRTVVLYAAVVVLFVVAGVLSVRFIGWWTMPLGLMVVAGAWLGRLDEPGL